MEKSYKIILSLSFLLSLFLLWLAKDNVAFDNIVFILLWGLIFFIIFSLALSTAYYFLHKNPIPFREILIGSIILTAFLFTMDYTVWDKDPPNPPLKQIIFESLFIGTLYASLFTAVFSGLYFITEQVSRLIMKRK